MGAVLLPKGHLKRKSEVLESSWMPSGNGEGAIALDS